jgi:hypothetical protein
MGCGIACAAPGQGFGRQCIGLHVVPDTMQLNRKRCLVPMKASALAV